MFVSCSDSVLTSNRRVITHGGASKVGGGKGGRNGEVSPTHSQNPAAQFGGVRIFFRRNQRRRCGRAAASTSGGTRCDTAAQERLISGQSRRGALGPRRSIPHGAQRGKVPRLGSGRASSGCGSTAPPGGRRAEQQLEPRTWSGWRERKGSVVVEHQAGTTGSSTTDRLSSYRSAGNIRKRGCKLTGNPQLEHPEVELSR